MKISETSHCTVTTKEGREFGVSYYYSYESKTHEYPENFDMEIDTVYDEDGWDVTENLTAEELQEIEQLTIDQISI